MKKNITRKLISTTIYKRFNKSLPTSTIKDAVNIICSFLENELLEDRAISVENFGTLSPFVTTPYSGVNIVTGKLQKIGARRDVHFHPHVTFVQFLELRRSFFL